MKKVSFGVLAMLLTFGWLLLMVSCSGGGSSDDSEDDGSSGGDDSVTVEVSDIPDVNTLITVASNQDNEDLAPITQTTLEEAMSDLDSLDALAATTGAWCTSGNMSASVCAQGGTYTWGPSGNGCEFRITNCDMGQGVVMNGTVSETIISSSNPIAVSVDMNMNMTMNQGVPVSYRYNMDVIIHSLSPYSYTVVLREQQANQYRVLGENCSVMVTWDNANSCFTVDSVIPAGCTAAASTCP